MTKLTTLKALRPALSAIGYDCWTHNAGGGTGYKIGQRVNGSYEPVLDCGTLKDALRHGNQILANGGLI
jgi:hypothetical protein